LRIDAGVENGSRVSVHYDPMLAKVIAHAPTRGEAASMLAYSLRHARIHGLTTNRELLVRLLEDGDFLAGRTHTRFIDDQDIETLTAPLVGEEEARLGALAVAHADRLFRKQEASVLRSVEPAWRNAPSQPQRTAYRWRNTEFEVGYEGKAVVAQSPTQVILEVDGDQLAFAIDRAGATRYVDGPSGPLVFEEVPRFAMAEVEEAPGSLHAPMPGRVVRVEVSVGDQVEPGQTLVVLEAMKMEHTLRTPWLGTVTTIQVMPGQQVAAETILVVVEPA
jgi:propionyl-CoA carboxylase alpha chain